MDLSSLITIVIVLFVLGFVCYLLFTYVPVPEPIRTIILVFLVIVVCLWLLSAIGVWHGFRGAALMLSTGALG